MRKYIVKENGTIIWEGSASSEKAAIDMAYDGITDEDCGDLSLEDLKERVIVEESEVQE